MRCWRSCRTRRFSSAWSSNSAGAAGYRSIESSLQNELAYSSEANEAATDREHRLVHVGAAFVADEQSFELVQVREGTFDDPADAAEAGAVLSVASRDHGSDPSRANESAVLVEVVAAVADQLLGTPARPPDESGDRGHAVEQRDQLGDVVTVAAGQHPGERDPGRVDEEMVL